MKRILLFVLMGMWLFSVSGLAEEDHLREIEAGKQLVESNSSCAELSEEQLEAMGEYYMEQMHPGEAHDLMHQMMGLEEGSAAHEQFHANMARRIYCQDSSAGWTMMSPQVMMNMMRGGGMMGAQQGMMGSSPASAGWFSYSPWWTVGWYLFWLLFIGLFIWLVYHFLIKNAKKQPAGKE